MADSGRAIFSSLAAGALLLSVNDDTEDQGAEGDMWVDDTTDFDITDMQIGNLREFRTTSIWFLGDEYVNNNEDASRSTDVWHFDLGASFRFSVFC